jgi:hypothetical protein
MGQGDGHVALELEWYPTACIVVVGEVIDERE